MGRPPDLVLAANADAPYEPPGPFRRTTTQLLQRLRARTEPLSLPAPQGRRLPALGLAYLDPEYPKRVLEYVWTDYQIHDLLLDWLGELAQNPSEQVRVRAGIALGVLTRLSFDFLFRNALAPWAESENTGHRDAVAFALRVAAADPELTPSVRALTTRWYRDRPRPLAQATAARVHGIALGPFDPVAAVDALERLFAIDDLRGWAAAIAAGVRLVMLSWATYPALDGMRPAGLSPLVVQDELRGRLGFTGVTITDALEAGALRAFGDSGQRAVAAAGAGADLILCSSGNVDDADLAAALAGALASGRLERKEFDAASQRIMRLRSSLS